jgi:hypothetical protein
MQKSDSDLAGVLKFPRNGVVLLEFSPKQITAWDANDDLPNL